MRKRKMQETNEKCMTNIPVLIPLPLPSTFAISLGILYLIKKRKIGVKIYLERALACDDGAQTCKMDLSPRY